MRHRITDRPEPFSVIDPEPTPEPEHTAPVLEIEQAARGQKRTSSVSNSFSPGEVKLGHQLLGAITRGADVRVLLRSGHFPSLARKFLSMKQRIDTRQIEETLQPKP